MNEVKLNEFLAIDFLTKLINKDPPKKEQTITTTTCHLSP